MAATDILVPMVVKALVVNQPEAARLPLAPIVKPDYTRLRLDKRIVDSDVLDHIDSSNLTNNDRTIDPLTNTSRAGRFGVNVQWILPHFYRTGMAASQNASNPTKKHTTRLQNQGFTNLPTSQNDNNIDYSSPSYRSVPNRWIVVRYVNAKRDSHGNVLPLDPRVPQVTTFVVESDRIRDDASLPEKDSDGVDWEMECSPYLDMAAKDITSQTGISIGYKVLLNSWQGEDGRVPSPPTASKPRRVQRITVGDTSNFLFADYQPHNINVFSIFDELLIYPQDHSQPFWLPETNLSYFVYGWHSNSADDPFLAASTGPEAGKMTNGVRLQNMGFTVSTQFDDKNVLSSSSPLSLKCHGSINDVHWTSNSLAGNAPCLDGINLFTNSTPVAVGSTTLDALLALIQAHQKESSTTQPPSLDEFAVIARDIIKLQTLLIQDNDTVDDQLKAADMLYEQNFRRVASGNIWNFSGLMNTDDKTSKQGGSSIQPTSAQQDNLTKLNANQILLDVALREAKQMQWLLFAEWWKYLTDDDRKSTKLSHQSRVQSIAKDAGRVQNLVIRLQKLIAGLSTSVPCEMGVAPTFYKQSDPTLLIGGIKTAWPSDWMDSIPVRLPDGVVLGLIPFDFQPDVAQIGSVVVSTSLLPPSDLHKLDTLPTLFDEFFFIFPGNTKDRTDFGNAHDRLPMYCADRRDCWNGTQPFSPLFIEWEVQYFHIPFSYWSLQTLEGKLQYGIKPDIAVEGVTEDVRIISGRCLLLPQAPFSLQRIVTQLFKHTSTDTLKSLGFDKQAQEDLCKRLSAELPFLSSPLSGFLDHLLTKSHGVHVKPNIRQPGQKLVPQEEAMKLGADIGLTDQLFQFIGSETSATPYAALVDLPDVDGHPSPFKPVVHGQFRFTKLNIIDTFGQVVACIDKSAGREFITPCTSQYLSCQPRAEGTNSVVNTVIPEANDQNEFVQLPPTINHEARMNCCFVVRDDKAQTWRPVTEWENPIWGWVVMNYPDESLQIFYPDGSFYRELTPGRDSSSLDSKWIPFLPPTGRQTANDQLERFVTLLRSKQNLEAIFNMISNSQDNSLHTPAPYAEIRTAVTGKPLALVNSGWSLELANTPITNQSSVLTTAPSLDLRDYQFQVQIGDKDRAFDGLVGYFDGGLGNRAILDFSTVFTYYPASAAGPSTPTSTPVKSITTNMTPDTFPKLRPFFISSLDADPGPNNQDNTKYSNLWSDQLRILGLLMDPYQAVHAYSGVLPMATLKLPSWPIDAALKKISTFFKLGPLLLTSDLPAEYDTRFALPDGVDLADFPKRSDSTIPIPIGGTAQDWNYLQPYAVSGQDKRVVNTEFNAFPTVPSIAASKMQLPPAPYTAVEGYLHLAHPVVEPQQKKATTTESQSGAG